MVDEDVNPPKTEERHLVVPLATELFLYYAFHSNEKKVVDQEVNITGILVDRDINLPVTLSASQHHQAAHFKNQLFDIANWQGRTNSKHFP